MGKTFSPDPATSRNRRAFGRFCVIEASPCYCLAGALARGRGGDGLATNAKVMLFLKSVNKSQKGIKDEGQVLTKCFILLFYLSL